MNYVLRQASESDKEFLLSLHKLCYHDVVKNQFGQWEDKVQLGFFEKKWKPSKFQIISVGNQSIGVVSMKRHSDHFFLAEIQINPGHQRQGLGSRIVRAIISDAAAQGLPVRLKVLRKSRARELYLRLGFVEMGETDTHILMEKSAYPLKFLLC